MKIAISADIHLISQDKTPYRFKALKNIFDQCVDQDIGFIFLTGDVFDNLLQDYSDFDKLCGTKKYSGLKIYLIPGNHDPNIKNDFFTADNVRVIEVSTWLEIDNSYHLLVIPYQIGHDMGEAIEENKPNENIKKWILMGHGSWTEGLRVQNPTEPGTYMPLTRRDIAKYKPRFVFLGHIHKQFAGDRVFYPGSPCGLDITETGIRYFLIFNTEDETLAKQKVNTDRLFFDEAVIILPSDNEIEQFKNQFTELVKSWAINKSELNKVVLRLSLKGYTKNRKSLEKAVADVCRGFEMYEKPSLSELYVSGDLEREYLVQQFKAELMNASMNEGEDEPDYDSVLQSALKLVYED